MRFAAFTTRELEGLAEVLTEHCERYEDTCEREAALLDELLTELSKPERAEYRKGAL